jgi:hypothetical protein
MNIINYRENDKLVIETPKENINMRAEIYIYGRRREYKGTLLFYYPAYQIIYSFP